jgi:hypothetical protein
MSDSPRCTEPAGADPSAILQASPGRAPVLPRRALLDAHRADARCLGHACARLGDELFARRDGPQAVSGTEICDDRSEHDDLPPTVSASARGFRVY